MAGRRQKPAELLLDRRRGRGSVVQLSADGGGAAPPPPPGLLAATIARWDAFWASPVASVVDRGSDLPRLERWILDVDELTKVAAALRRRRLVRGSTGQPVLSPLAGYKRQLEASIRSTEEHFGMTPLSRMRLGYALGEAHRVLRDINDDLDAASDERADEEPGGDGVIDLEAIG